MRQLRDDGQPACGARVRVAAPEPTPLTAPIRTDAFGTSFLYYATINGTTFTSTSVRSLARKLGRITLNPLALAESLAMGFVLRDETIAREIRSIPPHATLEVDGSVTTHAGPEKRTRITDPTHAARELRQRLTDVLVNLEPMADAHMAGFTGGKDSRILAALPKRDADRWHWLTISGRDDAEHQGSQAAAARLALAHTHWHEWTADFLSNDAHRVSADLANGIGAVSDNTLLRTCFEAYRRGALGSVDRVALWIGTLADGLLAGTYLSPSAGTLRAAISPRTSHLAAVCAPRTLEAFDAQQGFYDSNPFDFTPEDADDTGWFIRLLTRGRSFVCRSLGSFDRVGAAQINPYLDPSIVDLALSTDRRLLADDALRGGVLLELGADLNGPSAFGYRAPAYAGHVFDALKREVSRATMLDDLIAAPLLDAMREGQFPDLHPVADAPASTGPAYRVHANTPQAIMRNLRDYEHLLVYVTFLNLLRDDGVVIA